MKELTRTEMAAIKRVAKSTLKLRKDRTKCYEKMQALKEEFDRINEQIDMWETPVKAITGGFTSEQILDGSYLNPQEEVSEETINTEEVSEETTLE